MSWSMKRSKKRQLLKDYPEIDRGEPPARDWQQRKDKESTP